MSTFLLTLGLSSNKIHPKLYATSAQRGTQGITSKFLVLGGHCSSPTPRCTQLFGHNVGSTLGDAGYRATKRSNVIVENYDLVPRNASDSNVV